MTRPSERACCRRGGARQTEAKRSELHTHYARGLNIKACGGAGGHYAHVCS